MTTAQPGSVSSGTMRPEDLVDAFSSTLESLTEDNRTAEQVSLLEDVAEYQEGDGDIESAHELVEQLTDVLEELAPDGYYFGAHPGDGADFGFWPID